MGKITKRIMAAAFCVMLAAGCAGTAHAAEPAWEDEPEDMWEDELDDVWEEGPEDTWEYEPEDTQADEDKEDTGCLVIRCGVRGNMASMEKYFRYTVRVDGTDSERTFTVSLMDDGDPYTIDGNADLKVDSNGATSAENRGQYNPESVSGKELGRGVNFYLHHGQSVAIPGLPAGSRYSVTEDPEDYEETVENGLSAEGVIGDGVSEVSYVNIRNGMIHFEAIPANFIVYPLSFIFGVLCASLVTRAIENRTDVR